MAWERAAGVGDAGDVLVSLDLSDRGEKSPVRMGAKVAIQAAVEHGALGGSVARRPAEQTSLFEGRIHI